MIRRISLFATLPLALALTTLLLVAKPAHAWFGSDLWKNITCVADINCTVRAASTAALNFAFNLTVGQDYDKLTDADIIQMANGTWQGGLASTLGQTLASAYTTPPIDNLASVIKGGLSNNILNNPVSAADTQEAGNLLLLPVQNVWSAIRDLAYGLFAVVMVAIGIMIIARKEVSPRLVVTFTGALPKIVLGLVLITFSYPIVAFLVDLMQYATEALFFLTWNALHSQLTASASVGGLSTLLTGFYSNIMGGALGTLNSNAIVQNLGGLTAGALATMCGVVILFVGLIIVGLILVVKLIFAWAWILIYTIFSPLLILFGTLPGQEGTITDLGKKILAKGLLFPITVFFLLLAWSFSVKPMTFPLETLTAGANVPVTSGVLSAFAGPILTLAMIVAAFKAQSLVEEALTGGGGGKKKK